MSKIQVQTTIDTGAFLAGASQLQIDELEQLAREIQAIIVRKINADNPHRESALLDAINKTVLPEEQRQSYRALAGKLETATLTESEHQEFMALVEKDETLRNERAKYLLELAQLKDISLSELLEYMGLNSANHG